MSFVNNIVVDLKDPIFKGILDYIAETLKLYLHQVADYLQLWDPFLDINYKFPKGVLKNIEKYGIAHYMPAVYPNEGIMALKNVSEPVFNHIWQELFKLDIERFLQLVEFFNFRTPENYKSLQITSLKYLISHTKKMKIRLDGEILFQL